MVVYHGTSDKLAKSIQREGLKPNPSQAFDTVGESGGYTLREIEAVISKPHISVAKAESVAQWYANFRSMYDAAKPMTRLGPMVKLSKHIETTKPVVIKLDIPDTIARKLTFDLQEPSGLTYTGTIPPQYIREIIPATIPHFDPVALYDKLVYSASLRPEF